MYGRRDLVDSHLFLRGRLTSVVLRTDPDAPDRPLRRNNTGMNIGIAVAVVVGVVVVVLNIFLFKVNDVWRDAPGALILEESTGTRYLLINDTLHPVRNLASAALVVGAPPQVVKVSADDIAAVPRGTAIGEEGLPDTLPAPSAAPPVWTVCAAGDSTSLNVAPLSEAVEMTRDEAVLVTAADELYLIWNGMRHRMRENWAARALGFEPRSAKPVELGWLDTIPSGADIDLSGLTLDGEGPAIAGETTTLGQLIQVSGAGPDTGSYVVTDQGLMPVTATIAVLLSADPDSGLPEARSISQRDLASATVTDPASWQERFPSSVPEELEDHLTPCSIWNDGAVTVAAIDLDAIDETVKVAPGSGLLASTASAPGVNGAGLYLISETGMKYPVADTPTAAALGLDAASSPAIPEEFLALLPTGPLIAQ